MKDRQRRLTIFVLESTRDFGDYGDVESGSHDKWIKAINYTDYNTNDVILCINSLIKEGYFSPIVDIAGGHEKYSLSRAQYLTVAGEQLLNELKRPRWEWCKRHWHILLMAAATLSGTTLGGVLGAFVLHVLGCGD